MLTLVAGLEFECLRASELGFHALGSVSRSLRMASVSSWDLYR